MRPAVSVHIFGELRQAIRARFAREDFRILKERRGLRGLGEFRAEGAVCAERRLAGDKRRAGDVPERAGAAVAQHDLIAVGNLEEIRQAFADGADHLLDRGVAVRGAQKIARAASSAWTCSGRILLGPEPKRPSSGSMLVGMFTVFVMSSKGSQKVGLRVDMAVFRTFLHPWRIICARTGS